jgi:regulator of sigma E protease
MIFFHELGHFLAAKFFKVKVLKFALGFGPKIVAREVGETEYSIRYLPLGGFVKMLGEDELDEESLPIDEKDAERAFNYQHPLKRIAIVAAGPVFNLILSFILFLGLYTLAGDYIRVPEVGEVIDNSPAQKAGVMVGDVVIRIDDTDVKSLSEMNDIVSGKAGVPITITARRGDKLVSLSVIPEEVTAENEFGEEIRVGRIGIYDAGRIEHLELSPLEAFNQSLSETWQWVKLTCLVVVKLFQGSVSLKTIGGPIMIGQMTGELVQSGVGNLIPFMAIISINLGIINLLPIPILDGGVILFLLFELVMRKPLSVNKREIAQRLGLSLLLLLMAVVFYNDILRLFTK